MPNGLPLLWNDLTLAEMATVAPGDMEGLREWWYANMPPELFHYIDVLEVGSPQEIPSDLGELETFLDAQNVSGLRRGRLRGLFGSGSLLFTSGVFYYSQRRQRLSAPRGVVFSLTERMSSGLRQRCGNFRRGEVPFEEWQTNWAETTINTHFASGLLGSGFDSSEQYMSAYSQEIRGQLGFLMDVVTSISEGNQPVNGALCYWNGLYARTGYGSYNKMLIRKLSEEDFEEYRSVLNPAEHCSQCIGEADRGFVPVGMLIPIGSRTCLGNCKCHYEFRSTTSGTTYTG